MNHNKPGTNTTASAKHIHTKKGASSAETCRKSRAQFTGSGEPILRILVFRTCLLFVGGLPTCRHPCGHHARCRSNHMANIGLLAFSECGRVMQATPPQTPTLPLDLTQYQRPIKTDTLHGVGERRPKAIKSDKCTRLTRKQYPTVVEPCLQSPLPFSESLAVKSSSRMSDRCTSSRSSPTTTVQD